MFIISEMEQEILFWGVTCYFKCKCEFILNTIVWPFCQIPHHDMEVNVLAGLLSGKKCHVLQLHLAGVVQHGASVKTSLRDGHVVFDPWWNEWKGQRQTAPKWKTSSLFWLQFCISLQPNWKKKKKNEMNAATWHHFLAVTRLFPLVLGHVMNMGQTSTKVSLQWVTSKPHGLRGFPLRAMCVHGTRRRLHSCTHCECLGSKEELQESFLPWMLFWISDRIPVPPL